MGQATALSDTMSFQEVETLRHYAACVNAHNEAARNPVESLKAPCGRRPSLTVLPRFPSPELVKFTHSIRNKTGGEKKEGPRNRPSLTLTLVRCVVFSEKQRGNSLFLDDDRNGALQQSDGNDEVTLVLDPQENSLRAR